MNERLILREVQSYCFRGSAVKWLHNHATDIGRGAGDGGNTSALGARS